jgi:hypothetical protein
MSKEEIETNKYRYLEYTHQLNDYNEIENLNSYVALATSSDKERLSGVSNNLRIRVLKLKQEYLLYEHGSNLYTFRTRILYFTIICISLILFFIVMFAEEKLGAVIVIIACSVILGICLFVIMIAVIFNKQRRSYAYDQYYWQEPNLDKVTSSMKEDSELKKSSENNNENQCKKS